MILAGTGMFLMGCAGSLPASVGGGECKVFRAPDYAIRGKAQSDQDWIDDNTEAGIAACKWSRPKIRPMPVKAAAKVAAQPAPVVSTVAAPPPVKRHWWQRLRKKK